MNNTNSKLLDRVTSLLLIGLAFVVIESSCTNDEMQQDFYLGTNASAANTSNGSSSSSPPDDDDDGLGNKVEEGFDILPKQADSDNDGYADGLEFVGDGGDPSNSAYVPDPESRAEIIDIPSEVLRNQVDSDKDGLGDTFETENELDPENPDGDGDGYSDALELVAGSNPFVATSMPERANALLPNSDIPVETPPDTDGDGLSNDYEKNSNGSDEAAFDTDKDGFSDGIEYLMGSEPTDPGSVPNFVVPEPPASSSSSTNSNSSTSSGSNSSSEE